MSRPDREPSRGGRSEQRGRGSAAGPASGSAGHQQQSRGGSTAGSSGGTRWSKPPRYRYIHGCKNVFFYVLE